MIYKKCVKHCRHPWPVLLLALLFFFPSSPTLPSQSPFPPPLPQPLPLSQRNPRPPSSWKQPRTLIAHARPHPTNATLLRLTLLTTGVDTITYGRKLSPAGCLIGRHALPSFSIQPELITCDVPSALLQRDVRLTVMLHRDALLSRAREKPVLLRGETFSLDPDDVVDIPSYGLNAVHQTSSLADVSLAAIRSDVRWDAESMLDAAATPHSVKYELCVMTAMKQYPFLLQSWFDYYRRLGVDQFFIYDNAAEEDLSRLFQSRSRYVQTVYWPWPRSQMQSNNHFLLRAASRCRFVAFFDADEYVMVGGRPPVDNSKPNFDGWGVRLDGIPLLKRYVLHRATQGFRQIVFHFLVMVNSGYVRRPQGELPKLYTHRAAEQAMKMGKTVIDTGVDWEYHKIHLVQGVGNRQYWNETMELEPKSVDHNALLVHYTKRSWEDFVVKNAVGGASIMTAGRPPTKLDVDKPDPGYMRAAAVEWTGFRTMWEAVMKGEDNGRVMLTWVNGDRKRCRAAYCSSCRISAQIGEIDCFLEERLAIGHSP